MLGRNTPAPRRERLPTSGRRRSSALPVVSLWCVVAKMNLRDFEDGSSPVADHGAKQAPR